MAHHKKKHKNPGKHPRPKHPIPGHPPEKPEIRPHKPGPRPISQ